MTKEEKMAEHKKWQSVMADALEHMLTEKGPGLLALRIFYAVRHKDDTNLIHRQHWHIPDNHNPAMPCPNSRPNCVC